MSVDDIRIENIRSLHVELIILYFVDETGEIVGTFLGRYWGIDSVTYRLNV